MGEVAKLDRQYILSSSSRSSTLLSSRLRVSTLVSPTAEKRDIIGFSLY